MIPLVRYFALQLWRCFELLGLVAGLLFVGWSAVSGHSFADEAFCFSLAAVSFAATWTPARCFRDGGAALELPFTREGIFAARTLVSVGFLALCLLLVLLVSFVMSQGHVSTVSGDLVSFYLLLGVTFQLLGAHGAMRQKHREPTVIWIATAQGVAAMWVACGIFMAFDRYDASSIVRVLTIFEALLCAVLLVVTYRRYLAWEVVPGDGSGGSVCIESGSPSLRKAHDTRGPPLGEPGASDGTGQASHPGDGLFERAVAVRETALRRGRGRLAWTWLIVMRYGHFWPWMAAVYAFMILLGLWTFARGYHSGQGAGFMCFFFALWVLVADCLQLSYLPICRRTLFRVVCLPLLVLNLLVELGATPWADQYTFHKFCWAPAMRDGQIQTIGAFRGDAFALGASKIALSDDSGYTRPAPIDSRGGLATYDPYEFDASDPPSFAVYQAQRYFHDMFNVVVPCVELRTAYDASPGHWLEIIDGRYAHARRAGMMGRHITALGLTSTAVLLLILLCFWVMRLGTRVRHTVPAVAFLGLGAYCAALEFGRDVRLKAALAMLCDVVFRHPLLCVGIWLVCCTALYLWIESAFEQLEPSASLAQKRRPGLGL